MNTRVLITLLTLLGVWTTASSTGMESGVTEQEWRFRVLLDEREIGYHSFRLSSDAGQQVIDSEARFRVSFFFIPAYRYDHVNRERWGDDCLLDIRARTEINGDLLSVSGGRNDDAFVLRSEGGERRLDGCVMSFAYWNPAFLEQTRLLNSQTGDYLDVDIKPVGQETLTVRGLDVPATRYSLTAPTLSMNLWYSADSRWLGLESVTSGGRKLRYELL
jgi:hypothetical protein